MRRTLPIAVAAALSLILVVDAAAAGYASRTLKVGSSGKDVRYLQRYLDRAGYETSVDGEFGTGTRDSVEAFELAQGGSSDGKATRTEQRLIRTQAASNKSDTTGDEAPTGGGTAGETPTGETAPTAPVEDAYVGEDGLAVAPESAPEEVKEIIAAGNEIADKPYKYGGGHGRWRDSGYDCSGSISYALHGADLLDSALASGGFMNWEERGRGDWVTIRANAGHAYMIVAGLRFDTSAFKADGSRWSEQMRSSRGYVARHPEGL